MTVIDLRIACPVYDADFYGDAVIADPYPHYRALRDAGAAVWLSRHNAWALSRYKDVREALLNDAVFASGEGVMMNAPTNEGARGSILCIDAPKHPPLRKIIGEPLMPKSLAAIQDEVAALADAEVERLVARGSFEAVADLAQYLPVVLVSRMVGLPEAGRERMLDWAYGLFNAGGALNERAIAGLGQIGGMREYFQSLDPADLRPGSWGARLFECAKSGHLTEAEARRHLIDYTAPALDTTVNATASAIWLFGAHPDQWEMLRADTSLISSAINEVLRLETPIRAFSRIVRRDHKIEDVTLRTGDRALLIYASANRDERKWDQPERFDITRKAHEQLAFGVGAHTCVGMHLAKLEMRCLFEALARRVSRFELGEVVRIPHNVLRGPDSMQVKIHPLH